MQYTANCGPVVPPANGYIMNYTSTLEDVNVTIVCEQNIHNDQTFTMASCNAEGNWEPNPSKFCLNNIGTLYVCVCVHMCACTMSTVCMVCVCVYGVNVCV